MKLDQVQNILKEAAIWISPNSNLLAQPRLDMSIQAALQDFVHRTDASRKTFTHTVSKDEQETDITATESDFHFSGFRYGRINFKSLELKNFWWIADKIEDENSDGRPQFIAFEQNDNAVLYPKPDQSYDIKILHAAQMPSLAAQSFDNLALTARTTWQYSDEVLPPDTGGDQYVIEVQNEGPNKTNAFSVQVKAHENAEWSDFLVGDTTTSAGDAWDQGSNSNMLYANETGPHELPANSRSVVMFRVPAVHAIRFGAKVGTDHADLTLRGLNRFRQRLDASEIEIPIPDRFIRPAIWWGCTAFLLYADPQARYTTLLWQHYLDHVSRVRSELAPTRIRTKNPASYGK